MQGAVGVAEDDPRLVSERVTYDSQAGKISGYLTRGKAKGKRPAVIAIHENNIFDRMVAELPDAQMTALDKRYGPITLEPRKLKFIDRIVADSRDIGLNHTAGLSLPQQTQAF